MDNVFNPKIFNQQTIQGLKAQFDRAEPYRHIVIENFLTDKFAELIHENFPSLDALSKHYKGLNEQKSEGSNFASFHPAFSKLREGLNTPEFRQTVEQI